MNNCPPLIKWGTVYIFNWSDEIFVSICVCILARSLLERWVTHNIYSGTELKPFKLKTRILTICKPHRGKHIFMAKQDIKSQNESTTLGSLLVLSLPFLSAFCEFASSPSFHLAFKSLHFYFLFFFVLPHLICFFYFLYVWCYLNLHQPVLSLFTACKLMNIDFLLFPANFAGCFSKHKNIS